MALMETLLTLLVAVIAFIVRIGVMNGTANLLLYQEQSWKKAGKIVLVEMLLNFALSLSVWLLLSVFGFLNQAIGALIGGLTALIGGLYLLYYMMKYTAETYETNFLEGAVIYLIAGIVAALIIGGFRLLII